MRNRAIQRALRRERITKEQLLSRRDFCGVRDPTPYDAVKNIIDREETLSQEFPCDEDSLVHSDSGLYPPSDT